jgi:hypothetical protein
MATWGKGCAWRAASQTPAAGSSDCDRLAQHLALAVPDQRGFKRRKLFRMRQFYEADVGDEKK